MVLHNGVQLVDRLLSVAHMLAGILHAICIIKQGCTYAVTGLYIHPSSEAVLSVVRPL